VPVATVYDATVAAHIIARHGARPELLVQMLVDIVERFGWVPDEAIRQLASELNLSRADVHGVVSYYHDFRTEPPGRYIVKICQAEACQAMGSRALTEHARETLGIELGRTVDEVTLEPVYCLGNCACAPSVMIGDRTYGRVTDERFDELIGTLGAEES
jgi:formate dehydrogenase subunit gamma